MKERLVEGISAPLASSLSIEMPDERKDIGWLSRETATEFTADAAEKTQ